MKKILSHHLVLKIKNYIFSHKKRSVAGFLVLAVLGYWGIGKLINTAGEIRYVMASTQKNTIVVSITGSGQVSASNQVDVKAKTSGDVVYVGVKSGDEVRAGTILVQLDARDAQKSVRDAQTSLESAQLSLEKLVKPADTLALLQAENSLAQAGETLDKSYGDGFNSVSNTYLDLPNIMTGFENILYGTEAGQGGQGNISAYADMAKNYSDNVLSFRDDAVNKYQAARKTYEESLSKYKTGTRFDGATATEDLINQTYSATKTISDALKNSTDFLNLVKDLLTQKKLNTPPALTSHLSSLADYTGKANTRLDNLLSLKNTITSSKRSIAEKTESLAKLKAGADDLDLKSENISLTQRENALIDAREKLADAYVRAPFDGVVAKVSVKKLDSVSSGASAVTFISQQKLAEISLNEVDAAKIKSGQKTNITFDAVDGLNISGEVAEVDAVGTVSQGVVTYNIKIAFDTQDDRIKPGMSLSASIITDVKQDVLAVPVSAVKYMGNSSYVEMFDNPIAEGIDNQGVASAVAPRQQIVEAGLSNDTLIEIISGLKEGDQVISRTITPTTAQTTAPAPSLFGNQRGGGVRIPR